MWLGVALIRDETTTTMGKLHHIGTSAPTLPLCSSLHRDRKPVQATPSVNPTGQRRQVRWGRRAPTPLPAPRPRTFSRSQDPRSTSAQLLAAPGDAQTRRYAGGGPRGGGGQGEAQGGLHGALDGGGGARGPGSAQPGGQAATRRGRRPWRAWCGPIVAGRDRTYRQPPRGRPGSAGTG